ncbi:MAG: hypothetical protein ACLFQX_01890 [Candidatus Kapaibacterium sp.]
MKSAKFGFIILIITIWTIAGRAQEVDVKVRPDTTAALIGERIGLSVEVGHPADYDLIWPAIGDTLGALEVIDRSTVDTLRADSIVRLRQRIEVTSFDTGRAAMPQLTFMYEKTGITAMTAAHSASFGLRFAGVEADTSQPIKDIKPPLEEPLTLMELLPYIFGGIALIALAAAIYIYFKKRRRRERPAHEEAEPSIPAHILALEALRNLDKEKLWQNDEVKKYHIELTHIVRLYIQRRFDIPALEMTTSDIIERMRLAGVAEDLVGRLRQLLTLGDLAKFAKFRPLPDENTSSMKNSVAFVESTKPEQSSGGENE